MNIIALNSEASCRHVVFGHSTKLGDVTYCGIYFKQSRHPHSKQRRCRHCTKELHKAGMSWAFYEQQEKSAIANRQS